MDTKNSHGLELSDKDLEQVNGGKGKTKHCDIYEMRSAYATCQNPEKGLCSECSKCSLNK